MMENNGNNITNDSMMLKCSDLRNDGVNSDAFNIIEQNNAMKRKRANYSDGEGRKKIEAALAAILSASAPKPNVRAVADEYGIPYNTLRDHYIALSRPQLMNSHSARPKLVHMNGVSSSFVVIDTYSSISEKVQVLNHRFQTLRPVGSYRSRRGRKTALPKLVEQYLRIFITEMEKLELYVDKTQLKQVALKVASDVNIYDFKATDMWVQAFLGRHHVGLNDSKKQVRICPC